MAGVTMSPFARRLLATARRRGEEGSGLGYALTILEDRDSGMTRWERARVAVGLLEGMTGERVPEEPPVAVVSLGISVGEFHDALVRLSAAYGASGAEVSPADIEQVVSAFSGQPEQSCLSCGHGEFSHSYSHAQASYWCLLCTGWCDLEVG